MSDQPEPEPELPPLYELIPPNEDGISPGKWFMYHDYQRKDMMRAAQNAANSTLQVQWVFMPHDHTMVGSNPQVNHDGRWWTVAAKLEPNRRQALAGLMEKLPWRT